LKDIKKIQDVGSPQRHVGRNECTAAQTNHSQDCGCLKITIVKMPNVTWVAKHLVRYLGAELA